MSGIRFDEDKHQYTNPAGEEYISVTTFIKKFADPFDALEVATRYAEKHGYDAAHWMAQWDEKRDKACFKGSRFHKFKEDTVAGRGLEVRDFGTFDVQNPILQFLRGTEIEGLDSGIYLEMPLWNDVYKVAGTPDKIVIDKRERPYVDIDDYKTNAEIAQVSYKFAKSGKHKMMLGPCAHLMDCNFYHYALQLSLYGYMMECFGYEVRTLRIIHYKVDDLGNPLDEDPTIYPVPYLKWEIIQMLEYKRKNGIVQLKYKRS